MSGGCLEGAWRVLGGFLSESGYCMEGYNANNAKHVNKNQFGTIVFIFHLLSQCGPIGKITKNGQKVQTPVTGVKTKVLMQTKILSKFYI